MEVEGRGEGEWVSLHGEGRGWGRERYIFACGVPSRMFMSGNGTGVRQRLWEGGRAGEVKQEWRQTEHSSTGVDGVKGDGRVVVPEWREGKGVWLPVGRGE